MASANVNHFHGFAYFQIPGIWPLACTSDDRQRAQRHLRQKLTEPFWDQAADSMTRQCVFDNADCMYWVGEDY